MLDQGLVAWLKSMKICSSTVESVHDVMFAVKQGVLLCDLVELVTKQKLANVVRQPLSETTQMQNIRKALDVLRKLKQMSQKFTWSDQQF